MADLNIATLPIQGKDVLTMISEDDENWYTLVCAEKTGYKSTLDIKQRNTQCGPIIGVAPSHKRQIPFEGVFNQVDDALVNQEGYASGKKLQYWHDNKIAVIVKQIYDDGSQLLHKFKAYISEYTEDTPMDDAVTISLTLELWGNPMT
jgi:hypothetical protein